jgi:hypothetical protein
MREDYGASDYSETYEHSETSDDSLPNEELSDPYYLNLLEKETLKNMYESFIQNAASDEPDVALLEKCLNELNLAIQLYYDSINQGEINETDYDIEYTLLVCNILQTFFSYLNRNGIFTPEELFIRLNVTLGRLMNSEYWHPRIPNDIPTPDLIRFFTSRLNSANDFFSPIYHYCSCNEIHILDQLRSELNDEFASLNQAIRMRVRASEIHLKTFDEVRFPGLSLSCETGSQLSQLPQYPTIYPDSRPLTPRDEAIDISYFQ